MAVGPHLKHICCAITSTIFGVFYLAVLFMLALAKNVVSPSTPYDTTVTLSKEEKKLVFDLQYYLKLQGFNMETHNILTSDGHVLEAHRIVPASLETNEKPRYPLLFIPGLMQSSSAFCTSGPNAIGIVLAKVGYDVWLGNNRGGFTPTHVEFGKHSAKMWDWDMNDLATKDVPAMVNYIKHHTSADKVAISAHSQGTAQTFMALSRVEHGGVLGLPESVSSFSALAPAVFAGPLVDRWFLRMLRVSSGSYHAMVGYHAFIGLMGEMRKYLPLRFFTYSAYIVFNYMLAWDDSLWDRHYRDRNFIFAPVFVSAKLMFWWLGNDGFAHRKCIFKDESSKWFDEKFPPLELYACGRDNLVVPDRLINRIHNYEPDVRERHRVISLSAYSHLDVLWAMDASVKVAEPMAQFIWDNVEDKAKWVQPQVSPLMA